jgi:hypothetical protein
VIDDEGHDAGDPVLRAIHAQVGPRFSHFKSYSVTQCLIFSDRLRHVKSAGSRIERLNLGRLPRITGAVVGNIRHSRRREEAAALKEVAKDLDSLN